MMWHCKKLSLERARMGKISWEEFDKIDKEKKTTFLSKLYKAIIESASKTPHPDPPPKKKKGNKNKKTKRKEGEEEGEENEVS